ncbi:hypothetical protein IFM61606_02136 [Aspergillus udagawae]|uniref:Mucin-7 n=1 Tax=Aspergillus udagawae TaxID=91492 RepID=A0ABQ1B9I5_9EURO|nr:hypothetical protein IFM51744_02852 [Aspergillus udagawae]GFF96784.1 hypothetical protein IFM53868_08721 [Aspergillus udagawae]GFG14805.1 hypothetical protein IFM5058_07135 [Aspergillus udagawae]GFG22279.1 hypothetical protein IFM61606_02136 [Aspergillus udagawae]
MSDKGAHPGVRSLLAKFENNNQNSTASPPPRGRSPIGSDQTGTSRPLSKVRASFISVDRTSQGSPVSGLRSPSSPIDGAVPPSRVRSFNSEDFEAALKSSDSSSSPSNSSNAAEQPRVDQPPKNSSTEPLIKGQTATQTSTGDVSQTEKTASAPHTATETAPAKSALKPTKTVTKRPSNVHIGKTNAATKSPANPRAPTSPAKPSTERTSRPAHSTKTAATKDDHAAATRTATHKPSRTSLNTTAKTATRPIPASMPPRDSTKPATTDDRNTRPKSPARASRLQSSKTTSSLSSTAKGGSGPGLTRKPSTLKKAVNASQSRATTPTAASVRKQASRPSLPAHSGTDRPHSRVSNASAKPVDDSFLARMMRPTASSASKVHDKIEIKSPPRSSKPARAPRTVASKTDIRAARPPTEKTESEKNQRDKAQPASSALPDSRKELQAAPVLKEVSEEQEVKPEANVNGQAPKPVSEDVEKPVEKPSTATADTEKESTDASIEPVTTPTSEAPLGESASAEVDEPAEQPLETIAEQSADVDQSKAGELAVPVSVTEVPETVEASAEDITSSAPVQAKEHLASELPAEPEREKPVEHSEIIPAETKSKTDDVVAEMENLTIA